MTPADAAFMPLVAAAFLLEAILGFGSTVLVVTVGAQFLPLDVLLPTYVPVNMLLSGWLVARHRSHVDRPLLLRRILPVMGTGMGVGLLLPEALPRGPLLGAFGLFVVALALPELIASRRRDTSPVPQAPQAAPLAAPLATAALFLGGAIHGLFGSGGPLVVYVMGRLGLDKGPFRATLSALWLILNAVLVANYVARGVLNGDTLLRSAALLPCLAFGAWLGERLHARVDVRLFRTSVFTLLLLAGLSLALRNLLP